MSADLTTIREAALAIPVGDDDKWGERRRDEILAALDRIEQNTLTPEEAQAILDGQWAYAPGGWLDIRAKLDRIAGNTEEVTQTKHA